MISLRDLRERLGEGTAVIGVVGLGYVGLPVAATFAEAGFPVIGVDLDAERVEEIRAGRSPIGGDEPGLAELVQEVTEAEALRVTTDHGELSEADVVLIAVETPIDETKKPRFEALEAALRAVGENMHRGTMVIVESTIAPGTTEHVVRPVLEASSGMEVNRDFAIGHCPERVMPGKLLHNLRSLSRVCGGYTQETAVTMAALYRHVVRGELDTADCVTAELVKTAENAYRDVNIAFANELALICEAAGGDVWQVRELVNKSPGRNVLLPGAGVGGHCLPKDPWLLALPVLELGRKPRLIVAARQTNDEMPLHVAEVTRQALQGAGIDLAGARVLVLGCSYRENTDDARNAPSRRLVEELRRSGLEVAIHDPFIEEHRWPLSEDDEFDATVLMVAHRQYVELDPSGLPGGIVVDARGIWRQHAAREPASYRYIALGVG